MLEPSTFFAALACYVTSSHKTASIPVTQVATNVFLPLRVLSCYLPSYQCYQTSFATNNEADDADDVNNDINGDAFFQRPIHCTYNSVIVGGKGIIKGGVQKLFQNPPKVHSLVISGMEVRTMSSCLWRRYGQHIRRLVAGGS